MATLKSIKNKYLTSSDGTVLGVTTNTENISLLSFKLATADSLSKFNLVDGMSDDYNDATGVDSATSTNDSRSSDNYYYGETSVDYKVHTFTSNGTYTTDTALSTDYLIVGGGGGGGGNGSGTHGGGGGAGGYRAGTTTTSATSYPVVVGAGGPGGQTNGSGTGVASSWNSITGAGGGGGGNSNTANGSAGGSGGGAGRQSGAGAGNTPSTSPVQGYPGGAGAASGTGNGSGGGGGASMAGTDAGIGAGGYGGDGIQNDIKVSGTLVYYAGGGGGYAHSDGGGQGGAGGAGGGGPGNMPGRGTPATAGTNGLGGGGGGGGHFDAAGMVGGSGVVILRHLATGTQSGGTVTTDSVNTVGGNMTLQSNAFTAQTQPTTTRIILDEADFLGTTTLDTDIKAYASRDNGTTFTQIPLADQGVLVPAGQGGIDSYTKLLLNMDGAFDGTTFTDSSPSPKTVGRVGDPVTRTNVKKFGTASGWFDGNGDALTLADSEDWNFGSGDFTIDWWCNLASMGNFIHIGQREAAFGWELLTSGSNLHFWTPNGSFGADPAGSIGTITATWTHLAVVRYGNNCSMYKNGVSISSTDGTAGNGGTDMADVTSLVSVGARSNGTYYPFDGYIDEMRVSKGIARWTANFTPPTAAYDTEDPFGRRLLSGSVDVSGQPAGTNMKYKIETLNQNAASKLTRVYGTSMAWA